MGPQSITGPPEHGLSRLHRGPEKHMASLVFSEGKCLLGCISLRFSLGMSEH